MRKLLEIFLIITISGCTTMQGAEFDGDWKFKDGMACLDVDDIIKLKKLLRQCEMPTNEL